MEIPYGYCQCGCGQKTRVATETNTAKGQKKGVPLRYITHHNLGEGEKAIHWKGGRRLRPDGYILAYIAPKKARLEHRVMAEQQFGPLPKGSIVHHFGAGRTDNDKIMVFASHGDHAKHHADERALAACGHAHWRKCSVCHQYDDPANMSYVAVNRQRYHKSCKAEKTAKERAEQKAMGIKRKIYPKKKVKGEPA